MPVVGVNADKALELKLLKMLLATLHGGAVDEYLQDQVVPLQDKTVAC